MKLTFQAIMKKILKHLLMLLGFSVLLLTACYPLRSVRELNGKLKPKHTKVAIPPDFPGAGTILAVQLSSIKFLEKVMAEEIFNYKGEFTLFRSLITDTIVTNHPETYRYILRIFPGTPMISGRGVSPTTHPTYDIHIYDRKEDKKYSVMNTPLYCRPFLRAYIQKLNERLGR